MKHRFRDRAEGGRALGRKLAAYGGRDDVLVLALPRGGVPVAFEVAEVLDAPLDVFLVRKLGLPGHEEFAMGAIATGGTRVLDRTVIADANVSPEELDEITARERRELERREREYRGARPPPDVEAKIAILVDDGLATGSTMRAAIAALRTGRPRRIVVAVPTAAAETCDELRDEVDEIVCATTPEPFFAVGIWYEDFSQTTDDEVRMLLERARERHPERER